MGSTKVSNSLHWRAGSRKPRSAHSKQGLSCNSRQSFCTKVQTLGGMKDKPQIPHVLSTRFTTAPSSIQSHTALCCVSKTTTLILLRLTVSCFYAHTNSNRPGTMYVCMYICLMSWGPTEGQQTSSVYANSSGQNVAPKRKTVPNESTTCIDFTAIKKV